MVRLVVSLKHDSIQLETCFNSTMVRLVVRSNVVYVYLDLFQFHYGTIGSINAVLLICSLPIGFNSTMVRLVVRFRIYRWGVDMFQFHYGTIGR